MATNQTRKKRGLIAGLATGSVVAVALIITLSIVLTRPGHSVPTEAPPDDPAPPAVQTQAFGVPVKGEYSVDKVFANDKLLYNVTQKVWRAHEGIDLKADRGTEVVAVLDGTVTETGSTRLNGSFVTVTHSDGRVTTYKSLEPTLLVKEGDKVEKGAVLGTVGDTMFSEHAQGPHLHFELRINGETVDPADYIADFGGK